MATLAFALLEVGTIECPGWRRPGRPHPGRPGHGRRAFAFLVASAMIDSLFRRFPGKSGETCTVEMPLGR